MKLNRIHTIIGALLVVVPFLGLTRDIKYGFSIIGGAVILYFAINSIHIELRKKHKRPHRHDTFVENRPAFKEKKTENNGEDRVEINKVDSVEIIENLESSPISSNHIADKDQNL